MANLSDAWGTIEVEKVGQEFLDFLEAVQGGDAYYLLVESESLDGAKPDKDGNLSVDFSTSGRWSYTNNLEGYLGGQWMHEDESKEAYAKFIKALEKKDGRVSVEYTDSDVSMDWMGTGMAELIAHEGEPVLSGDFHDEEMSVAGFARLNGDDELWALSYLHGEEAGEAYDKYLEQWKKDHSGPKFEGMNPSSPDEWYDNEYEEEI